MQVLELEYSILLTRVLARRGIFPFRVFARKRMVKQVPVVVLPVCVAGKPEQSRDWHYENARTVEWIDVTMESTDGVSNESPAPNRDYYDESPQSPIRLDELVRKEVSTD